MKKLTVIIAFLIMLAFAGCTDGANSPDVTSPDTAPVTDAVTEGSTAPVTAAAVTESETVAATETETEAPAVTDAPAESGITVHTESFTSGECYVTLMYPIYGDGGHDAFDVAMRNHAMQKYNQSGTMTESEAVYEITDCDVKYESDSFVSAVMIGHIISPTAAHDTHFAYTVNADPRNGRVYLSEELIGDLDLLKGAMHGGRFAKSYGIDGLESAIADGVVTYEVMTQSWRSDYGVFPDMYFTEDNFGVVAELPHVVGGYAGFEIPYADAGDMINPVARGLAGLIVTTD